MQYSEDIKQYAIHLKKSGLKYDEIIIEIEKTHKVRVSNPYLSKCFKKAGIVNSCGKSDITDEIGEIILDMHAKDHAYPEIRERIEGNFDITLSHHKLSSFFRSKGIKIVDEIPPYSEEIRNYIVNMFSNGCTIIEAKRLTDNTFGINISYTTVRKIFLSAGYVPTPHNIKTKIDDKYKKIAICLRKETGAGAENIQRHLIRKHGMRVSTTTIHKWIKESGLVELSRNRTVKNDIVKKVCALYESGTSIEDIFNIIAKENNVALDRTHVIRMLKYRGIKSYDKMTEYSDGIRKEVIKLGKIGFGYEDIIQKVEDVYSVSGIPKETVRRWLSENGLTFKSNRQIKMDKAKNMAINLRKQNYKLSDIVNALYKELDMKIYPGTVSEWCVSKGLKKRGYTFEDKIKAVKLFKNAETRMKGHERVACELGMQVNIRTLDKWYARYKQVIWKHS